MTAPSATTTRFLLAAILVLAAAARFAYAHDLPLTGDEAGVGLTLASGQARDYEGVALPAHPVPLATVRSFLEYSDRRDLGDVVSGLRSEGMHPPLYYVFLHGVLKHGGSDTALLRSISILFSLASVLLLFAIGRRLGNAWTGLFAAAMLGLSGYGTKFGVLVRPYPLAMLLALLSTYLALRLKRDDGGVRPRVAVPFGLTLLAGIYTIHHFVFVWVFQAVFLFASRPRDRRTQGAVAAVFAAVGLGYLPWLPVLPAQVSGVPSGLHYFSGTPGLYSVLAGAAGFTFWIDLLNAWSTRALAALLVIPLALVAWGYLSALAGPRHRALALAGIAALATHLAADLALGTVTMEVPKIAFFLAPVSILFLALGIRHLPGPDAARAGAAVACLALLAPGAARLQALQTTSDGPLCLFEARPLVDRLESSAGRPLVVSATTRRRFLLPLAHMIDGPADVVHGPACDPETALSPVTAGDYGPVLLLRLTRPGCDVSQREASRALTAKARDHGLTLVAEHRVGPCALLLFE